jgi:hypothetical protein
MFMKELQNSITTEIDTTEAREALALPEEKLPRFAASVVSISVVIQFMESKV